MAANREKKRSQKSTNKLSYVFCFMLLRKDFLFEIKKNIYKIFILKKNKKQRKSKDLEGVEMRRERERA